MKSSIAKRVVVAGLLAGLFAGLGTGGAQALVHNSSNSGFCGSNWCYSNRGLLDDAVPWGGGKIWRVDNLSMAIGTVGAQGYLLIASNNAICTSTTMSYNTVLVYSYTNHTNGSYCGHILHAGSATTKATDGSGWKTLSTYNAYANL